MPAPSHSDECEARRTTHETGHINRDRNGACGAGRDVGARRRAEYGPERTDVHDFQQYGRNARRHTPAGTYVFRLADTPTRNVVQVLPEDEKNVLGQWTFVQAERPKVSEDTVVMFKETGRHDAGRAVPGTTPGERIGKEFIYPKDQAQKIANRTGATVLSEEGRIASTVTSTDSKGQVTDWQRENEDGDRGERRRRFDVAQCSRTGAADGCRRVSDRLP